MEDLTKIVANLSPEKRALMQQLLQAQGVDLAEKIILPQGRSTNIFPVSFSQQRLWFLEQLEPGSPVYNIPAVVRMRGRVDAQALEKSINAVVSRHEILRTTFRTVEEQPHQVISPELNLVVQFVDLSGVEHQDRESEALRFAKQETQKPFDLAQGPLLRPTLIKVDGENYYFLLVMHHIVSDGWSTGVLLHELRTFYAAFQSNQSVQLEPLTVQYADFSVWQRNWLRGKNLQSQLDYWKRQLVNCSQTLDILTDFPRPAVQSNRGSFVSFSLPREMQMALNDLARKNQATLFMVLLAAYAALLYRISGQDDLNIGVPIANRNRSETAPLIGFFINTLVMRANFSGEPTFIDFLARIREMAMSAFAHQDLPFEMLVDELGVQRDMSHSPFFQAMFVLNNAPIQTLEAGSIILEPIDVDNETTKFDLVLSMNEDKDGLKGKLEYNTDLFKRQTIAGLLEHFRILIGSLLTDPSQKISLLPMLSQAERETLLITWNQTERSVTGGNPVHELISQRVTLAPDRIAVQLEQESLTYADLDARSNQLAHHLSYLGMKPESLVGLGTERSLDSIVAMMAILKAGAAFVPFDPDLPQERLTYILEDAKIDLVLTHSRLAGNLTDTVRRICLDTDWPEISKLPSSHPEVPVNPEQIAYVIYTSGSTGRPKGVMVPHGAFATHCLDMLAFYELETTDRVLQFAATHFDASLEQIFPPLIAGATVVLRGNEIWDASEFARKVDEGLTVINPPTAYWQELMLQWHVSSTLIPHHLPRLVIVGGDKLMADSVAHWLDSPFAKVPLLNAYGPTEAVITSNIFHVPTDQPVNESAVLPIGRPLPNRKMYVLDRFGNPCPTGMPGELFIGGERLARGYLNRADLTAEKFLPDPFCGQAGARMYRTGDLVRYRTDGNIEFLGRIDHQVKMRGFRIELGEIESVINQLPHVRQCVAQVRAAQSGQAAIVAYIIPDQPDLVTAESVRDQLKSQLPEYMIPSAVCLMDEFPRTPIGKIDRRALPDPDLASMAKAEYIAPRNPVEETIAGIVAKVLRVDKVGIRDNFFDLGGHSLLATRVMAQVRQIYQVDVPLRSLFESPTVEGLSLAILKTQAQEVQKEDMEQMLLDLDQLSEDEVAKLLQEMDANPEETA